LSDGDMDCSTIGSNKKSSTEGYDDTNCTRVLINQVCSHFVWVISGFVFALLHLHAKQSMRCLYSSRMSKTRWYLKEHMCQCCAVGRYQPWSHGGKVTNICQSQKLRTLWRLIQTSSNQLCLPGLVICLKKTGKL